MTAGEIAAWLVAEIGRVTDSDPAGVDVHAPFDALGLSSSDAVILSGDLELLIGRTLSPTLVYEHPSIAALAAFLAADPAATAAPAAAETVGGGRAVAIVGIACRLPGAEDPAAFWRLLCEGGDAVREVPADRWDADAFYDPDPTVPGKTVSRWGGFLERIDGFDPFFFGISPGEAERMDPQQRLLLELAFEAFEDAGYPMPRLAGSRTAVLVGISVNEYGALHFGGHRRITGHSGTGASLSIAANRISYTFDLHGPSAAVDTACSSSLAAVHLACRSLRAGECDLALAGGVNLILSPAHAIAFTKAGVLAPDGRCKPFDARANGYVRGEGGGLVVLKPLQRALDEGDRIYAVIRGGAMAQDGRTNGLMAPNARAQELVLREAYRDAAVAPHLVRYVEAHGTGTLLGDAMEASALGAVMSPGRDGAPCALGSVKSNLGHLEAAAGVAGLLKVVLALRHRRVPPSLHFEAPNPHVPFESVGLAVQRTLGPWPAGSGPALAGVSSFGFGGTNVHLVVEEAPAPVPAAPPAGRDARSRLVALSAHTEAALTELARRTRDFIAAQPDGDGTLLEDLARTTACRRTHHEHRVALVARSRFELLQRLDAFLAGMAHPDVAANSRRTGGIAFVFAGQGGQWPGMARDLLEREPAFRIALEACDEALQAQLGWSVLDRLATGDVGDGDGIDVLQPVLFAVQVALAALWRDRGLVPDAVVGHSMGEVAAAHVAGALTLQDAARTIVLRSRLLRRLSGSGGMVLVGLPADETVPLLARGGRRLALAASNGPRATVVAGAHAELAELIGTLEQAGVFCRLVNVDVPAHGPDALPLGEELRAALADLTPAPPSIAFVSTLASDGSDTPPLDAAYWARNLTEPVRFADAMARLFAAGCDTFVELGPHPVLQGPIQQGLAHHGIEGTVVPSLVRNEAGVTTMLRALGAIYVSGRTVEWDAIAPAGGRLLSLPTYPWQRERFWLEPSSGDDEPAGTGTGAHPLLGRRIRLATEPDTGLWQTGSADLAAGFLLDHRVDDRAVLPAAAYVEMALAAAAETGADGHELVELSLPRVLELPEGEGPTLQIRLGPGPDGRPTFTVHGRPAGSDEWTLHATARFRASGAGDRRPPASVAPATMRAGCPEPVPAESLYRLLAAAGLHYGPRTRAVAEAWRGAGEAVGRIALPEALRHGARRYRLHPVLLDAALQTLAAAVGSRDAEEGDVFVPAGCGSVRLHRTPADDLWSHVVLRDSARDLPARGEIRADVRLMDDGGACIAELEDVRLVRKRRQRPESSREPDTWFYRMEWRPAGTPERAPAEERGARDWVLVATAGELVEALRSRLEAAGYGCSVLTGTRSSAEGTIRDRLRARIRAGADPLRGIVYLSGAGPNPVDPPETAADAATRRAVSALELLQAVAEGGPGLGTPRLWLVTRGAQQVLPDERVAPEESVVWGLGKSAALELPELRCTLVDLDPALGVGDTADRLAAELLRADAEDELALRGGDRLVARLLRQPAPIAAPACVAGAGEAPVRPDATYLITGGLGGLGLTVAAWMVERGARHLVLAGRSGASTAAASVLARLSAAGARVEVARVDVTSRDQVTDLLRRIRATMPPLEGVIHAAGVLENAAIAGLDPDCLARVLAPKAAGAWHLHEATRDDPLRFFVLFSSAVSVLGSPGQGNYAAANAFLDALARRRRASGLPASSINWGPWAEVGLVADSGLKGIRPARGLEVLDWVLQTGPVQVTVLPFDLATLLELYPAAARIPLFAEVGGRETHVSRLYARPQLRQAYVAPRNDVERRLAELWRQTLRIDRVGVRDSFFELGGDSVLAAQVIASIHRTLGVEIDVRDAFRSLTIESLAQRVESALVARLHELTEAEVNRLLQG